MQSRPWPDPNAHYRLGRPDAPMLRFNTNVAAETTKLSAATDEQVQIVTTAKD